MIQLFQMVGVKRSEEAVEKGPYQTLLVVGKTYSLRGYDENPI